MRCLYSAILALICCILTPHLFSRLHGAFFPSPLLSSFLPFISNVHLHLIDRIDESRKYRDDRPESGVLLGRLKDEVRCHAQEGVVRVTDYEAPAAGAAAMFEELSALLDTVLPSVALQAENEQLAAHEAFMEVRRRHYFGGKEYMDSIDMCHRSADAQTVLITGASGLGKSTLVSNWISRALASMNICSWCHDMVLNPTYSV